MSFACSKTEPMAARRSRFEDACIVTPTVRCVGSSLHQYTCLVVFVTGESVLSTFQSTAAEAASGNGNRRLHSIMVSLGLSLWAAACVDIAVVVPGSTVQERELWLSSRGVCVSWCVCVCFPGRKSKMYSTTEKKVLSNTSRAKQETKTKKAQKEGGGEGGKHAGKVHRTVCRCVFVRVSVYRSTRKTHAYVN